MTSEQEKHEKSEDTNNKKLFILRDRIKKKQGEIHNIMMETLDDRESFDKGALWGFFDGLDSVVKLIDKIITKADYEAEMGRKFSTKRAAKAYRKLARAIQPRNTKNGFTQNIKVVLHDSKTTPNGK